MGNEIKMKKIFRKIWYILPMPFRQSHFVRKIVFSLRNIKRKYDIKKMTIKKIRENCKKLAIKGVLNNKEIYIFEINNYLKEINKILTAYGYKLNGIFDNKYNEHKIYH